MSKSKTFFSIASKSVTMKKSLITSSLITLITLITFLSSSHAYITYIESKYPLQGTPSPPGSPWPLPQKWLRTETFHTLNPDTLFFRVSNNGSDCDILSSSMDRARGHMFIDSIHGKIKFNHSQIDEIFIDVANVTCGYPQLGDNESYIIEVPSFYNPEILIKAETIWGALRGLETLSQLVYQSADGSYLINATRIHDWPQYKYRGLLIDTARHFIPMKVLLDNLDAMAYNKFNVFHWHIVDDQSFPLESKLYPNLTWFGAYSPRHVYTQSDVRKVIQEARLRGIRVVPEIDTPGHTQGFGKAFPELLTTCYGPDGITPNVAVFAKHAQKEILDPSNDKVYTFFKSFFQEIKSLFKDDFIHLGMDEVYYDCWLSNPSIKDFMQRYGLSNVSQVEQYYVENTLKNVKDIGYKYMTWQDPVDNGVKLASDAVVQVWKDTELVPSFKSWREYIIPVIRERYQVILSSCWYLNYISYGEDWKKYYNCNPRDFNGTDEEKELVIGGEACMWSEFVDGTNILSRLWPRASAVAERLWSNPSLTSSTDNAQYRLDEHRCRMLRRGIPAQPILNGFCGDYEWQLNGAADLRLYKRSILIVTGIFTLFFYSFHP